jgi:hypothetical protein
MNHTHLLTCIHKLYFDVLLFIYPRACLPLPERDDEGRAVTIIRTGCYAPEDLIDHVKVALMCLDVGLRDEASQVHGFVTVLDFTEFTSGHVGCMGLETVKKMMKTWQVVSFFLHRKRLLLKRLSRAF